MYGTQRKKARATLIGAGALNTIKRCSVGEVHSVFERTFNILVSGLLAGVVRSDVSLSPIDILTDIPAEKTMPSLGIKKGIPVKLENEIILVDEVLEISLEDAEPWQPPSRVDAPLAPQLILRNLKLAKQIARDKKTREGLGQLLSSVDEILGEKLSLSNKFNEIAGAVLPHLVDMVKATMSRNINGLEKAVKSLIGLGPGLTPSADDMLTGFTSSLWWISRSLTKGIDYVDRVNSIIASNADKTNLLSRQLLQHATRGEVNERLAKLLEALLSGKLSDIEPSLRRVMKIGETSGIDMTVGVLLGIQVGLEVLD